MTYPVWVIWPNHWPIATLHNWGQWLSLVSPSSSHSLSRLQPHSQPQSQSQPHSQSQSQPHSQSQPQSHSQASLYCQSVSGPRLTVCSRVSSWLSCSSHTPDSIWTLLTILWSLSSLREEKRSVNTDLVKTFLFQWFLANIPGQDQHGPGYRISLLYHAKSEWINRKTNKPKDDLCHD